MAPRLPPRRLLTAIAVVPLIAGCTSGTSEVLADVSDEEITRVAGTWVNQLGLVQTDPTEWRERLTEACTEGVWNPDVSFALADRYIAEDRASFVGGDDAALSSTVEAANALWTMATQVCRDSFPAGAIHAGPP